MSGTVDTSQPIDRLRFTNMIENGMSWNAGLATAVINCQAQCPELTLGLLDMPSGTYAQAAARMLFRLANGPH